MSEEHPQHPKKPNNIDELRRLKQLKKEAKKSLNSKPQVEQSPPGKVYERPFAVVPDQPMLESPAGQVRVMTFNILAQSLIKRKLFPDSGDYLKWKQRRRMILDEIKLYNPDILTMQELDNFEAYYEAMFAEMGYQVLYYTHPAKRHGCGIAFKKDKFDPIEYDTVDYNTDALCQPSYMTGNIAQLLALQLKSNPSIGLVVGNTHLYWRPSSNYERFRQTIIYSNRLLEFKQKLNASTRWEPLLLGDFNTTPDDAAYGLLTTSQLSDFHVEDLNTSRAYKPSAENSQEDQEDEEQEQSIAISVDQLDSIESLLAKYHNDSKWKSIYSHFGSVNTDPNSLGLFGEPRFTDYASQFQGTLDYMFIDSNSLVKIKSLLLMPYEQYLKPSLPNKHFGSDHLSLVADLDQNQKTFSVDVAKDETVAAFRRLLMKTLGILHDASFSLIALGKILQDYCQDGTPARLFSTYRVRDKSSVFVHLYTTAKKRKRKHGRVVISIDRKRKKTATVDNMNTITLPFDNFVCPTCSNDTRQKRCVDCGCICDQCNGYWHLECAGLTTSPKGQYWYCPECYNGDHENVIGKDAQLQSSNNKRLTVKGQDCTIVPYFHVGKIPGVSVGQTWATRESLAEWGVHRAPSKQVSGNGKVGAVSILLAYGIIEDRDSGDEFVYSGVGGDNKKKSVHSNRQIGPQTLENGNMYMAITCNAPVDAKRGGTAINWRKSQPIRVCRASTLNAIRPEFAPVQGYRYDGEYKIVKYWPFREPTTGNVIWKFLFRRDDPEMPPWTLEGRRVITRKRLRMIGTEDEDTDWMKRYTIGYEAKRAIEKDVQNKRLWDQIADMVFWSKFEFLQHVFDEAFACASHACSKPIKDPITLPCGHICCMRCLAKSKSNQCFTCRSNIPRESIQVNEKLVRVLRVLNPAYGKTPAPVPSANLKMRPKKKKRPTKPKRVRIVIEALRKPSKVSVRKQSSARSRQREKNPNLHEKYEPIVVIKAHTARSPSKKPSKLRNTRRK
ncbi:hypothetical protein [Parasitella parasitica]|uniref:RING-type E3 ubiquitin transferase n=1 Tax=Parasitella parasitica TaxID=35722 RepID=A0A0B7NT11_9FUNG|nr:hypothetical protein [Parasitella parasitica]